MTRSKLTRQFGTHSKITVPKVENFQDTQKALETVVSGLNNLPLIKIINGRLITGLDFNCSELTIEHKLSRKPEGYIVTRLEPDYPLSARYHQGAISVDAGSSGATVPVDQTISSYGIEDWYIFSVIICVGDPPECAPSDQYLIDLPCGVFKLETQLDWDYTGAGTVEYQWAEFDKTIGFPNYTLIGNSSHTATITGATNEDYQGMAGAYVTGPTTVGIVVTSEPVGGVTFLGNNASANPNYQYITITEIPSGNAIYQTQEADDRYIYLKATRPSVADIWVF